MRSLDRMTAREDAMTMGLVAANDRQLWRCHTKVERYEGDIEYEVRGPGLLIPRALNTGKIVKPYDVQEVEGNILTIGGASIQWQTLIGNGTTTSGQALTYYNNANAHISVGDNSGTAAADTQTELQAATNRVRKAMDATYPLHTDTTGTAGSKSAAFRSTYATGDANFVWNEWGIFNGAGTGGPPTTGGRMLNRKVEALGTKTSAATWVLTITLSLA
jgi:hypothetical protein